MAGKMLMLLYKEMAMKPLLTVLTLVLALNSSSRAEDNPRDLGFAEVGLQLSLLGSEGKRGPARASLAITNAATRGGVFRLPSPFGVTNGSRSSFAPFPPYVALLGKEPKSGHEELFVFTSLRKLRGPGRRVSLDPGQIRKVEYSLSSFYLCGPEGPRNDGRFTECLKSGDVELEVRALIFQKGGEPRILSNSETMRCAFPEWLFKGPFRSDHSRGGTH